jgi:transposase
MLQVVTAPFPAAGLVATTEDMNAQDRRKLRRSSRRWKVERLFAWLHNFRRLVVRYGYHGTNLLGLIHLACVIALPRRS